MGLFNIRLWILVIIVIMAVQYYAFRKEESVNTFTLPSHTKILAFGDSLTQGYGVDASQSYPSILSALVNVEVVNAGIAGELSAQGLQRLPLLLEQHQPHIVLLCHGANDILRRNNLETTKANIKAMIKMAKDKGIFVVLVGVPVYEILNFKTAALYYEVAKEEEVVLEDRALEKILGDYELRSDQVHPNTHGYALMARSIAWILSQYYLPATNRF